MFILTRNPVANSAGEPVRPMCFTIEASRLRDAMLIADHKVNLYINHVGHCVAESADESELVPSCGVLRYTWVNSVEEWLLFEVL